MEVSGANLCLWCLDDANPKKILIWKNKETTKQSVFQHGVCHHNFLTETATNYNKEIDVLDLYPSHLIWREWITKRNKSGSVNLRTLTKKTWSCLNYMCLRLFSSMKKLLAQQLTSILLNTQEYLNSNSSGGCPWSVSVSWSLLKSCLKVELHRQMSSAPEYFSGVAQLTYVDSYSDTEFYTWDLTPASYGILH